MKKSKKSVYREERLAAEREQTAVLRRIAAVLEQNSAVKAIEEER